MVKLRRSEDVQRFKAFGRDMILKDSLPFYPKHNAGNVELVYLKSTGNVFNGPQDMWDSAGGKVDIEREGRRLTIDVDHMRVDARGRVASGKDTALYKDLHETDDFHPSEVPIYMETTVPCRVFLGYQERKLIMKLELKTKAPFTCSKGRETVVWKTDWVLVSITDSATQSNVLSFLG